MERTYVVAGPVPGFREGSIVDMAGRRLAHALTDADMAVLRVFAAQLSPITAAPAPSTPAFPESPQATG